MKNNEYKNAKVMPKRQIPPDAVPVDTELGRAYKIIRDGKAIYYYPFASEYFPKAKRTFAQRLKYILKRKAITNYMQGWRYNKDLYLFAKKLNAFDENFAQLDIKEHKKEWALLIYDTDQGSMSIINQGKRRDLSEIESIMFLRQLEMISKENYYKLLRSRGFIKNQDYERSISIETVASILSTETDA